MYELYVGTILTLDELKNALLRAAEYCPEKCSVDVHAYVELNVARLHGEFYRFSIDSALSLVSNAGNAYIFADCYYCVLGTRKLETEL